MADRAGGDVVLVGLSAAMTLLAFTMFGVDKFRARRGQWRFPERSLLIVALFGGSVGAKLGQRYFRHKTTKQPFARRLNAICLLQVAVAVILAFPPGRQWVFSSIESLLG